MYTDAFKWRDEGIAKVVRPNGAISVLNVRILSYDYGLHWLGG